MNILCVVESFKGYNQPSKDGLAYSLSRVYNYPVHNRLVSASGQTQINTNIKLDTDENMI